MVMTDALRVGRRALRSLVGRDLLSLRQVAVPRMSLGGSGARWCVCTRNLARESIVYSFGVGEDLSFELALMGRYGVAIHAFEPTPRSLAWLRSHQLPPGLVVHEFGLAPWDGTGTFSPPRDPRHVSFSMVRRASELPLVEAPVHRLATIAGRLGHRRIDVLKMDIEGAEYGVIPDILASGLSIGQLLVEFHHRWQAIGLAQTKRVLRLLRQAGYLIANVSADGFEYTFLHADEPR